MNEKWEKESLEKFGQEYVDSTRLERLAFRICNKKMFMRFRQRRRDALTKRGIKPWF